MVGEEELLRKLKRNKRAVSIGCGFCGARAANQLRR
jgi:hypothetical protein